MSLESHSMPELITHPHFLRFKQLQKNGCPWKALGLAKSLLNDYPSNPTLLSELGILSSENNQKEEAVQYFEKALKLVPCRASYHLNLALALLAISKEERAINHLKSCGELSINNPDLLLQVVIELSKLKKEEEALEYAKIAYSLYEDVEMAFNLAKLYWRDGQKALAIEILEKACLGDSARFEHLNLLRSLYLNQNNHTKSFQMLTRMAQIDRIPLHEWHIIQIESAFHYLRMGDLSKGFSLYEYREKMPNYTSSVRRFSAPLWQGEDLKNKTILVHSEQGDGDCIQFARYLPLLSQKGAQVIFECYTHMIPLFQSLAGISEIIAENTPLTSYDFHCPIISLATTFKTTLSTIPPAVELNIDSTKRVYWKKYFEKHEVNNSNKSLKIGLVWAGNPKHVNDSFRSFTLKDFDPILKLPHQFFSLQKGSASKALEQNTYPIIDLGCEITNWQDTAAICEQLDLLLTPDTAIAHLSATLGKPTWIIIAKPCDWRWLEEQENNPWYPSVRLFRQCTPEDWASVIAEVEKELKKLSFPS